MTESQTRPNWRTALRTQLGAKRGAQVEFAREVQCSESHLSLVLQGKKGLSYPLAERISQRTGIEISELMAPPLSPGNEGEQ